MIEFNRQRAKKVLIEPFKKQGQEFLKQYKHLQYPRDLFLKLPKSETQERKALLAFFAVLFDSQKKSKQHYKEVLNLYNKNVDFFTLENILKLGLEDAKRFARKKMNSMNKKGVYLHNSYTKIQNDYSGDIMNVLDPDVIITQKRTEEFSGMGDQLSGLFLHILRDYEIYKFENEEDLCPKIDFHDYNLGISTGIINNVNGEYPQERKKLYSAFLRDLAKEEGVNIFDLDSYMWAIGQICLQKNNTLCEYQCPLSSFYEAPRTFTLKNDYRERATTNKNKKIAEKLQLKLNFD